MDNIKGTITITTTIGDNGQLNHALVSSGLTYMEMVAVMQVMSVNLITDKDKLDKQSGKTG